jgi:hypothetical protein
MGLRPDKRKGKCYSCAKEMTFFNAFDKSIRHKSLNEKILEAKKRYAKQFQ